jgi:hypothetical protein
MTKETQAAATAGLPFLRVEYHPFVATYDLG